PQLDPIVRVEARRLRAKLEAYYASVGRNDELRFEFPKGSYRANFRTHTGTQNIKSTETSAATIAVMPFTDLSPESSGGCFGAGLAEELIALLTHIQGLRVLAWDIGSQSRGRGPNLYSIRDDPNTGSFLRGSVRRTGICVRVTAQWIDTRSGAYLWS